jgi:hypothetical protein
VGTNRGGDCGLATTWICWSYEEKPSREFRTQARSPWLSKLGDWRADVSVPADLTLWPLETRPSGHPLRRTE